MADDEKRLMMRSCSTERLPTTSSRLVNNGSFKKPPDTAYSSSYFMLKFQAYVPIFYVTAINVQNQQIRLVVYWVRPAESV